MSILQNQVIQSLDGLSDKNLQLLLDIINKVMKASEPKKREPKYVRNPVTGELVRPFGLFKNEEFLAEGYDLDEDNDEIAKMFGVAEE